MAGANVELTVTANGNTNAIAANGSLAVQVTGAATAITLQMQRSTRDPAGGSPNWTNVGAAIAGNPSTGIALASLDARGGGWWRGVVSGLTGSPAVVSLSGDMSVASSISQPADVTLGTLALANSSFPVGMTRADIAARFTGKTAGSQLVHVPERIRSWMTSLTVEENLPGAKVPSKTYTFPITVTGALALSASTFAANAPAGTVIGEIQNVPAGSKPVWTPAGSVDNDKVTVAGDATNGWKLVAGLKLSPAGAIPGFITLDGIDRLAVNLTVNAGGAATTLRVIGNLFSPNTAANTVAAGNDRRESRMPLFFPNADVKEVWEVFAAWWTNIGAGGGETVLGNDMAVAAALEVGSANAQAPNALVASPANVVNGSTFLAGPIKSSDMSLAAFPKNQPAFPRASGVVPVGQNLPQSGMYGSESPASRRQKNAADASEVAGTGLMTGGVSGNTISPIAILADLAGKGLKAGIGHGNSVLMGDQDTTPYPASADGGGWALRSVKNAGLHDMPFTRLGRSGATLESFMLNDRGDRRTALTQYADFVLGVWGHNDLFSSNGQFDAVLATFMTRIDAWLAKVRAVKNLPIGLTTVSPRTTSTDSFATAANQSVQTNWSPVIVERYNREILPSYLQSGKIQFIFDHAADCERPDNHALWQDNRTPDGTHGNSTAHIAAAARFRALRQSLGF